jgi:hypothetical protein
MNIRLTEESDHSRGSLLRTGKTHDIGGSINLGHWRV